MLSPAQSVLIVGVALVADPTPYVGYGWRVEAELAAHDEAVRVLRTVEYGTREWRAAQIERIGAESRLAQLLDVQPRPRTPLSYDDGLGDLWLPVDRPPVCHA